MQASILTWYHILLTAVASMTDLGCLFSVLGEACALSDICQSTEECPWPGHGQL